MLLAGCAIFLAVPTGAQTAIPLTAGWYSVPSTNLQAVCPPNNFGGFGYAFSDNCSWVIAAWSSGTADTGRNRLIVWGGGHNDYYGNEIYAFDLNTLALTRLNNPSPPNAVLGPCITTLSDGAPNSRHTYNTPTYVAHADRMFDFSGSMACGAGDAGQDTWTLNLATLAWQRKDPTTGGPPTDTLGSLAAYDPNTKLVFVHNTAELWSYNYDTNAYQLLNASASTDYHLTGVVDPVRKLLILFGGTQVRAFSIASGSSYAMLNWGALVTGCNPIKNADYPGLAYDPDIDRIVGWAGGNTVYIFDPDTKVCTPQTFTGGPGAQQVNGTHGRWRYFPEFGVFVLVNAASQNVFTLRLSPRATFDLSTATSQTLAPFALGYAFRQGDIPTGQTIISANVTNFQADIKNRWPDGSAKFAVLSGRTTLTGGTPLTVILTSGTAAGGVNLTESDLQATGVTASIDFASYGTVQLAPLIGVASTFVSGRWTAGLVTQWTSGPEMSSWIYYSPIGTDSQLTAWFEVRLWNGGAVEVLPWIENGLLRASGPGQRNGTATFTLGGTTRYTGTLNLLHHNRAVLASGSIFSHWLGTDPGIAVKHNTTYLQATRAVPTYYGNTAGASPLWARLVTSYTPLARSNYRVAMGDPGYDPSIGIIPEWDVAYLTGAGDSRAFASIVVNAYCAGRYGIHYRDETTNRPLRFSAYPNLVINPTNSGVSDTGSSSTNNYTPVPTGTAPPTWANTHHPSVGYMAYLLTGRRYFMEETEFAATLSFLKQNDDTRGLTGGVFETSSGANDIRGAGWALRTLIQAANTTPDNDVLRTEFMNAFQANIGHYHAQYVAQPNNPQGIPAPYQSEFPPPPYSVTIWMQDFFSAAWGYGAELLGSALSSAEQAKLTAFYNWTAQSAVGRLGGLGTTEYRFCDAAQYTIAAAPSGSSNWQNGTGPWYANWGAVYQATLGTPTSCSAGLRGGNSPDATSYWGNLQPAISYAVENNVTEALNGYNRMISASNWSTILAGWDDDPVWGVRPRNQSFMAAPAVATHRKSFSGSLSIAGLVPPAETILAKP